MPGPDRLIVDVPALKVRPVLARSMGVKILDSVTVLLPKLNVRVLVPVDVSEAAPTV